MCSFCLSLPFRVLGRVLAPISVSCSRAPQQKVSWCPLPPKHNGARTDNLPLLSPGTSRYCLFFDPVFYEFVMLCHNADDWLLWRLACLLSFLLGFLPAALCPTRISWFDKSTWPFVCQVIAPTGYWSYWHISSRIINSVAQYSKFNKLLILKSFKYSKREKPVGST